MDINDNIIIIAPYEDLKITSDHVLKEMNMDIETTIGDLSNGVKEAIVAKNQNKEIVISRGGTARLIRENTDITVVEIKVTGYDLLRVLGKYIGKNKRIAVVGYSNVIDGARTIGKILGLAINYFVIEREEEAYSKLKKVAELGLDVVIGDTVAVKTAKKLGLCYELIVSGREAIQNAIDEARKIYQLTLKEREEKEQFEAILNFSHEGIIAIDKNAIIRVYNPSAEKIFKIPVTEVIGRKINQIIPNTRIHKVLQSGEMELGKIQKINQTYIATNRVPINIKNEVIGVVATFQDITKIQELEQNIRQKLSRKGLVAKHTFNDIIGESEAIKDTIYLAKKYSKIDATVLIYGKTGTGKELFAQAIHNESDRRNMPFVAVNCAALPSNLLESELFGYQEGAFTGARRGGKQGLFELAHNGTIFLDEISEMDTSLQARLLRVIQEREVMRIGDDKIIPIDVRIIVATNKDLIQEVQRNHFREDLYYRLNVLNLTIPELKERKEDIELLIEYFLMKFRRRYGSILKKIDKDVLQILKNHSWNGNIRELQNVVEKMAMIIEGEVATKENSRIVMDRLNSNVSKENNDEGFFDGTLKEIERRVIEKILKEEGYNKTKAAKRLDIDRGTINRKLSRD